MSELTYERAKQLYTPYDEGQMRHLCALRDVEIDRLQDENAKLRELVMHLYEYRQTYFRTGIYPTDHGVTERRMRELGVEVNE